MLHIHILLDPVGGAGGPPFCVLRPEGVRRPGGRAGGGVGIACSELARGRGAIDRGGAGGAGEPV